MHLRALIFFCAFTSIIFEAQAQASPKANAILSPTAGTVVTAGETFEIRWMNLAGQNVDLVLMDGPVNELREVAIIATNVPNTGSYVWDVPNLPSSGTNAIRISYDRNPQNYNYSDRFVLIGGSETTTRTTRTTTDTSSVRSTATTSISSSQPPSSSFSSSFPSSPSSSKTSESSTDAPKPQTSKSVSSASSTGLPPPPPSQSLDPSTSASQSQTSNPVANTSSASSAPPSQPNGPNTGVIVGAVIGGIALCIAGGLMALWIVARERRKQAAAAATTSRALPPPDVNNQSIWEGGRVYSYNVNKATPDIFPGQDDPSMSEGGAAVAPASSR